MDKDNVVHRPVAIASITKGRSHQKIRATEIECASLAKVAGVLEVCTFSADLDLERLASGTILVEGNLTADIKQACSISLVPVDQHINEPISLRFVERGTFREPKKIKIEIDVNIDEVDPPEEFSGLSLDLGPVLVEHFILAIDPYPKAEGALWSKEIKSPEGKPESPFAALEKVQTFKREE